MTNAAAAAIAAVQQAMPALQRAAQQFRRQSPQQHWQLLQELRLALAQQAAELVAGSVASKGWLAVPGANAEEWQSGPLPVMRCLALLAELAQLQAQNRLPPLRRIAARPGGAAIAALPAAGLYDRLLLAGIRATLHTKGPPQQLHNPPAGDVAVVLGAGNVVATPLLDVLQQVFRCGRACILKLSPVQAPLLPQFARLLQPLVTAGLLQLVAGDGSLGAALCRLPGVAAVHLTGSLATFQALQQNTRGSEVAISAELGGCSPALVLPWRWRPSELRAAARQLAAYVASNGGCTCLAPRVLLTAAGWPQREQFLQELRLALSRLPARVPFLPGTRDAYQQAVDHLVPDGPLPPSLRSGLALTEPAASRLLQQELFAPVLLEFPLSAADSSAWLAQAVHTAQSAIHGSLCAYLFAPTTALRQLGDQLDQGLAALPHFTVAINCWTGLGYGLGLTPWGVRHGADPSHGLGQQRGSLLLHNVEQVVLQAPLRPHPLPPWLPWHRRGSATLAALVQLYAKPGLRRLLPVLWQGLHSP